MIIDKAQYLFDGYWFLEDHIYVIRLSLVYYEAVITHADIRWYSSSNIIQDLLSTFPEVWLENW